MAAVHHIFLTWAAMAHQEWLGLPDLRRISVGSVFFLSQYIIRKTFLLPT